MNYYGEQFIVNTTTQRFTVPEFTTWDASLFFDRAAYRIGLKVDNLNDKRYWNAWGAPQAPRRVIGNVAYRF
jgi:iron complex outermembrane receptor protein